MLCYQSKTSAMIQNFKQCLILVNMNTLAKVTLSDLYLIYQQNVKWFGSYN
jgi:hypothetical protein